MSFQRIIVIAPTRSTCVNLHHLIGLSDLPQTLLERVAQADLSAAIAELPMGGFGVVAGTGTGKSAAIRQIYQAIKGAGKVSIGIVTQEHRASRGSVKHDVLVVTPGVAVMWAKNGQLSADDLIIIDEVHQTSEHLELAMALLKRIGCTFVWMSATIDPTVYAKYFGARRVITCSAYDPDRRANVTYHEYGVATADFMEQWLPKIAAENRGVAIFVPSRDEAESLAKNYNGQHGVHVSFYHGGEPAEKLRAYIQGDVPRPYVIAMTSAGASSLNIAGLDTVVIVDSQFKEIIRGGKARLDRVELDANTLLQMAGRVDGRAIGGEVHIIAKRPLDLHNLRPVAPSFVLGGDLELLALTTARLGIDVRELSLIGQVDEDAYRQTFDRLISRGLIALNETRAPRLTKLGRQIEPLPVPAAWGEVVVKARELEDNELLQIVCLTASVGELYKLTGKKWRKHDDPLIVWESDHLTGHNIVAEALRCYGKVSGGMYRLNGADFNNWCKTYGYSQKEIRNVALLLSSLIRQLGIELPEPQSLLTVDPNDSLHTRFVELLAAVQSMEFVEAPSYGLFGNSQWGVTNGDSILGQMRHWTSKRGQACATIEGTRIPTAVVQRYARQIVSSVSEAGTHQPGVVWADVHTVFAGKSLRSEFKLVSVQELPPEVQNLYQWQSWTQRPPLAVPDPADDHSVVPDIVVCTYGAEVIADEPQYAYGTLVPYDRYRLTDPWFEQFWTRDPAEAERRHEQSVLHLEAIREQAKGQAESRRLLGAAEPLRLQIEALYRDHYYDDALPRHLREQLYELRRQPQASDPREITRWTALMRTHVDAVEARLAALAAQEAEVAGELAKLQATALSLRDRIEKLLDNQQFSNELYDQLVDFSIDDDQLPGSPTELTRWIEEAKTVIARAELLQPTAAGGASDDALAALAARFNSR